MVYVEQKNFQKIDVIEVKRCFVIAQYIRKRNVGKKRYLPELTQGQFKERFEKAKKSVLKLSEDELDDFIADEYKKRLKSYNFVDWYIGMVHADEVGVWRRAGGLPISWTQGSLKETAEHVSKALKAGSESTLVARSKRAIPRIKPHIDIIKKNPYLFPIVLPGGTEGRGVRGHSYKGFRLMKGDVDDGCMRAITLVLSGRSSFAAYVGIQKRNTK